MSSSPQPHTNRSHQSIVLVVLAVLVAILAIVVLLPWTRDDDVPEADMPATQPPAAAPVAARATAATDTERKLVATPVAEAAPPPPPAPIASEPADLDARDWLTVLVVDAYHEPIADAEVRILGLRKQSDPGSWYGMRGGETAVKTDAEGRARIDYTRWVDIDGKAIQVDLAIAHPDYVAFRDSSFELRPEPCTVQLQRGAMVRLTAWYRTRSLVVRDIDITMDWESKLGDDGWHRDPDGTCSTTRLAPGPHFVAVTHSSPELGSLASGFALFVLGDERLLDVDLELHALATLRGQLDAAVPRPVVDGHVQINLHAIQGSISQSDDYEATVASDGTFAVPGLRPGSGQLIAWCRGWVSRRIVPRTFADLGETMPAEATAQDQQNLLEQARTYERIAQPVADSSAQDFVVAMEPTGALQVSVTDEQGKPLPGVSIDTSPNVQWRGVGSTIFPWGTWQATTDAEGIARIVDLPPDESLFVDATSGTHRLRKADRDQMPTVVIDSGTTTQRALVLEAIPK